jgi:hypothetical protein
MASTDGEPDADSVKLGRWQALSPTVLADFLG